MADSSGERDHPDAKVAIRARLLSIRRQGPAGQTRSWAGLRSLVRSGQAVAGYVPLGSEPGGPDLPDLLADAVGPDGVLWLPVLREDRDLDWAAYRGHLVGGARHTMEPDGPRLGLDTIGRAALVVVPAVAVDRRGVRLGRGGGSYDRALARVPSGTLVVALLHDGELVDHPLPAQPHDRRVGAVLTPGRGLVRLPLPAT